MKIIAEIRESCIEGLTGMHVCIEVHRERLDNLRYREVIDTSIFKSSFDLVWEGIGEKIKQGLLEGDY